MTSSTPIRWAAILTAVVCLALPCLACNPVDPSTIPQFSIYPPPAPGFPSSPLFSATVSLYYASNGSIALSNASAHVYFNSIQHRSSYDGAKPTQAQQGQSVSFTSFSFSPAYTAEVTVVSTFTFQSCVLRPLSYGLNCVTLNSTAVRFALPSPMAKVGTLT